MLRNILAK